jgi:hypothetical protein
MTNESPRVQGMSRNAIEKRANSLLEGYFEDDPRNRGWPLDVIQLAEFLDDNGVFELAVEPLAGTKEGEYRPVENQLVLTESTYKEAYRGFVRPRFTVVHEIGHAILDGKQLRVIHSLGLTVSRHSRTDLRPFEDPEWQADAFAAAALMPSELVIRLISSFSQDRTLKAEAEAVAAIKEKFNVSQPAAKRRLSDLRKLGFLK